MHKQTGFLLEHLETPAAACPRWQVMLYLCFLSVLAAEKGWHLLAWEFYKKSPEY